nr:MAG: hypothetical protein DIU68_12190 [Chloroflexota bacterium]
MHTQNRRIALALTLIALFAGFAVRLALHDYHGLEGDDGFSLSLTRYPLEALIPGLMRLELDIHPPLHFVLLKGWIAMTGDSLLSLRLMNILSDLLAGAFAARLAGRAFGRRAGLVAAALWAFAPLLIYSTYLIRMYTLSALFAAGGAACTLETLKTGRLRWAIALGLFALAGLYTHIVGAVAAATFGLALVAGGLAMGRWRGAMAGLAALVIAGVLFLPFALPVLDVYRSGRTLGAEINTSRFGSALEIPGTVARVLLLHRPEAPGLVVLVILLAAAALALWRYDRRAVGVVVLAWAGLLGMMALALFADLYKPRYLAPFALPALALLAGGVAALPRRVLRAVALFALVAGGIWGVVADLDRATRDDWIAATDFVQAHERPGDAIIIIPDWGQEAFAYHYEGNAPVTGIFPRLTEDVDYAPILQSLAEGHDGVWLVRYQPEVADPEGLAERWFNERAATAATAFPAGMRVTYYDFQPRRDALPPDARPLEAQFGDRLALRGVYLPVTSGPARDTRLHPPSNWVRVALYWEALQANVQAQPRVRLTDTAGQVYGATLDEPNGVLARFPVNNWQPGDIWQVNEQINVNPETPPGVYNIEVMALDPATGEPLPASGADAGDFWVIAGQFHIE